MNSLLKLSKFKISFEKNVFLNNNYKLFNSRLIKKNYSNISKFSNKELKKYNKQFDKMIRIRFEKNSDKVGISVKCKLTAESEREFNLNRSKDEPISVTFQKLYANFSKQLNTKMNKKAKKNNESVMQLSVDQNLPLSIHDLDNNVLSLETKNIDAWKENYTFKLQDQSFKVTINLPEIKKVSLSKIMAVGLPVICSFDVEYEDLSESIKKFSKFNWYYSDIPVPMKDNLLYISEKSGKMSNDVFNQINSKNKFDAQFLQSIKWIPLTQNDVNTNGKYIVPGEECLNKLIRVEVMPSDGNRIGLAIETISTNAVMNKIDLNPITERHKLTTSFLHSDELRVMTYNILAKCYSETTLAKEELYPYCQPEYLDFNYRRALIVHEILNFKLDLIFLQECEVDFFEEDLNAAFPTYTQKFKAKGESREAEEILFRSDRFKFINSHDICLADELKTNVIFENLWKNISKNTELKDYISKTVNRTILQIVQVESLDYPGVHYLLANTHLFFHPDADFIRLIQSIVCTKYLEKLKYELLSSNKNSENPIKDVNIIFAGDFNSDPPSHAFKEKSIIKECEDELIHSLNLTAFADFPFTNCVAKFEGILDYVFYESNSLELNSVIPLPTVEVIKENVALPSKYFPSDHLPLVFQFKIKSN